MTMAMKAFKLLYVAMMCMMATVGAKAQESAVRTAVSSDFVYGIDGGVGALVPAGSVANNFKGCFLFHIGATGGYDNWRLKTDVHFGQPSFKNANIFNRYDEQGHPALVNSPTAASFLGWGVQVGYKIVEGHRLSITPNAGIYHSKYSWNVDSLVWSKNDKGEDQFKIENSRHVSQGYWSWIASVDFDYRLSTKITDTPFLGNGTKRFTSSIRFTPFVSYTKHGATIPATKGLLVGATIGYLGLLQSLGF